MTYRNILVPLAILALFYSPKANSLVMEPYYDLSPSVVEEAEGEDANKRIAPCNEEEQGNFTEFMKFAGDVIQTQADQKAEVECFNTLHKAILEKFNNIKESKKKQKRICREMKNFCKNKKETSERLSFIKINDPVCGDAGINITPDDCAYLK